jgi:N-acetylglucosaminyldiphosphoundecaprenol N-acetyl-beta-D-mannosaminyltransferase
VGGVPFEVTSLSTASAWLVRAIAEGPLIEGVPIRLSNAYCVALAQTNADYKAVLAGDGLTFADGAPVAWAQQFFLRGHPLHSKAGRVRGPSFFTSVIDQGQSHNLRHFFLGSTPQTLELLEAELKARFPTIRISGTLAPPFGPVDEGFIAEAIESIEAADPQIVWIGMGTPKQDHAAAELAKRLPLAFVGVGAAFDFVAGTVTEAPRIIQRSGFEWLYRLAKEPRRLGKRYLVGNLEFIRAVLRHRHNSELSTPPVSKLPSGGDQA